MPSRFPAFHLKCPAFLANFELEKMRPIRSFQRQVELRRLGNQLPMLGKANSHCTTVKCFVFCLFIKLRLSGCVDLGIKISRVMVARAKSVYRVDNVLLYQLCPLAVGGNTNSRFLRFFGRSVPLFFRSLMLTPMRSPFHECSSRSTYTFGRGRIL